MRQQAPFFALILALVAANNGFSSATASEEAAEPAPKTDEVVTYEVLTEDGTTQVHTVNKQLVEVERKKVQEIETVNKQLAEVERKQVQLIELMQRLVSRILDIKLLLAENQDLDETTRSELLEELSVKTAAIREIYRSQGDSFLERTLEYITVDFGLEFALFLVGVGKAVVNLIKDIKDESS